MKKLFYLILLSSAIVITSCKKDKKIAPTPSSLDLIKDSVFLYAKQVYYWNESLPTVDVFKPRSFSGANDLDALQSEIDAMTQYSKNPETGKPYEYSPSAAGTAKYSFIDDGSVSDELNGIKGDFGFAPVWIGDDDIRVKYVYPGSPADVKGIKRGYQITSINGRTGSGLTYDGGNNVNFLINAYLNSSNINLTLKKPDGSTIDVSITTGTYTVNPVLTSNVVDAGGGKKIGYIVFNSFTSDENARPKLNAAFATFSSAGVTDLVVDLRYNGGGYVSTAEYLSNLIAPATKTSGTMFTYNFNKTMVDGKDLILKNQVRRDEVSNQLYNYFDLYDYVIKEASTIQFSKTNLPSSLNLNNVFFIVTGSTASASELTINNLLPLSQLNVKLIGTTSYGKPVGFFNIDINKYEMYIPEFETKNSAGNGGYYAGMTPGTTNYPGKLASDDVTKEFGDPTEKLFALAISYVKTGTFSLTNQSTQSLGGLKTFSVDKSREVGIETEGKMFKGMIYNNNHAKRK
ncbi:carboxyl-terminal processing protease [Mucilaginibacter sp. UYP25]|uniref:S41 family peptidase n=1 Tax=unclassified Mucilaginibacter TaxID=2617802 RepID=UPI003397B286